LLGLDFSIALLSSIPDRILVDAKNDDDIGDSGKADTPENDGDDNDNDNDVASFLNNISRDTTIRRSNNDGRIVGKNTEFFIIDVVRGFIVADDCACVVVQRDFRVAASVEVSATMTDTNLINLRSGWISRKTAPKSRRYLL